MHLAIPFATNRVTVVPSEFLFVYFSGRRIVMSVVSKKKKIHSEWNEMKWILLYTYIGSGFSFHPDSYPILHIFKLIPGVVNNKTTDDIIDFNFIILRSVWIESAGLAYLKIY